MEKKTIFILEDDQSFAIIFKRWLEDEGFRIVVAENIVEAREKLEKETPVLFWLDYYLKNENENGMDFFRWLKKEPRFQNIPVVVVSVTVDMKKLKEFEKEGVKKTFSKNITNRDALIKGVREILG